MDAHRISAGTLLASSSLEMTGRDLPELAAAAPLLRPGTRVNVTYLGAEDLALRVKAAKEVKRAGLVPVPHVAARRLDSASDLDQFLARLATVGAAAQIFAVGGDPAHPAGPYPDSLSLIRSGALERAGTTEVAVAGYPEGHPDIPAAILWEHLERKVEAAAERGLQASIITQFGFDAERVSQWIGEVRERGIDSLIRVGTPGPAGVRRLLSFARRFGVGANTMIVKKYGFSLTNLLGTAGPDRFIDELADVLAASDQYGDVGLHFYTFGGLASTAGWLESATAAHV